MQTTKTFLLTALLTTGLLHTPSGASLLVYDGFSGYNTGPLAGQTANGTGLTGNWTLRGNVDTNVQNTGLTFGSLATSGGAASIHIPGKEVSVAGVQLNHGSSVTGTLYSSMLFNVSSLDGTDLSLMGMRVSDNIGLENNNRFSTYAKDQVEGGDYIPGVAYNNTPSEAGQTLSLGTTYMAIGIFENVGEPLTSGNPGEGSLFVLNEAQFEDFVGEGRNESNLTDRIGNYGANADQISAYAAEPSNTSGDTFLFEDGDFMGLASYSNEASPDTTSFDVTGTYDEIRWGTSLDSITVIPEPGTLALVGLSVLALSLFRRRR